LATHEPYFDVRNEPRIDMAARDVARAMRSLARYETTDSGLHRAALEMEELLEFSIPQFSRSDPAASIEEIAAAISSGAQRVADALDAGDPRDPTAPLNARPGSLQHRNTAMLAKARIAPGPETDALCARMERSSREPRIMSGIINAQIKRICERWLIEPLNSKTVLPVEVYLLALAEAIAYHPLVQPGSPLPISAPPDARAMLSNIATYREHDNTWWVRSDISPEELAEAAFTTISKLRPRLAAEGIFLPHARGETSAPWGTHPMEMILIEPQDAYTTIELEEITWNNVAESIAKMPAPTAEELFGFERRMSKLRSATSRAVSEEMSEAYTDIGMTRRTTSARLRVMSEQALALTSFMSTSESASLADKDIALTPANVKENVVSLIKAIFGQWGSTGSIHFGRWGTTGSTDAGAPKITIYFRPQRTAMAGGESLVAGPTLGHEEMHTEEAQFLLEAAKRATSGSSTHEISVAARRWFERTLANPVYFAFSEEYARLGELPALERVAGEAAQRGQQTPYWQNKDWSTSFLDHVLGEEADRDTRKIFCLHLLKHIDECSPQDDDTIESWGGRLQNFMGARYPEKFPRWAQAGPSAGHVGGPVPPMIPDGPQAMEPAAYRNVMTPRVQGMKLQ
jgi:hypothetical protein